jgi:YidC/Oxa1 family membrane protein insertase
MDFFIGIYDLFLKQPVFNALIVLVQTIPGRDFGVAVILLTLIIRFASYPLGAKAVHAQKKFAELQPKIKELQEKYKDKKQEQTKAMLELYREAKINPLASFLPLLIQLPIFIVLYQIFSHGLHEEQFSILYSFVAAPETIDPTFLGFLNLNEKSIPIALVAGVLQFVQLKQASPKKTKKNKGDKPDVAQLMQTQMPYIFPALIIWIAASLPSAFGLYLIATTVFSIWQHWFITRHEQGTPANN